MDRETMERLVVRILALVEHCNDPSVNDPSVQVALRQIAADLESQWWQASAEIRGASRSYMLI